MNPQIQSLIRTALKFIGAFFIAHGWTAAGNEINLINTDQDIGLAMTGIGMLLSIFAHSGTGTPPAATAVLLALALPALALPGCASAPANAYKAEATTDVTISAAMSAWGDYVAQFHPGTNAEMKVEAAFTKAQITELIAIDSTAAYAAMVQTNSTAASSVPVQVATQNAAQALADLVSLIESFGVQF